jgi:hypothetical protein
MPSRSPVPSIEPSKMPSSAFTVTLRGAIR